MLASVAGLPLGAAADDEYAKGMKRLRAAKAQQQQHAAKEANRGDGGSGGMYVDPGDGFAHPFGSIDPAGYAKQVVTKQQQQQQQQGLVVRSNGAGSNDINNNNNNINNNDGGNGGNGDGEGDEWGGVTTALEELRHKVATLEKELYDEKLRTTTLKEEKKRPLNIHRWNAVRSSVLPSETINHIMAWWKSSLTHALTAFILMPSFLPNERLNE